MEAKEKDSPVFLLIPRGFRCVLHVLRTGNDRIDSLTHLSTESAVGTIAAKRLGYIGEHTPFDLRAWHDEYQGKVLETGRGVGFRFYRGDNYTGRARKRLVGLSGLRISTRADNGENYRRKGRSLSQLLSSALQ